MGAGVLSKPRAEEADEGSVEDGPVGVGDGLLDVVGRSHVPEDAPDDAVALPLADHLYYH